MATFPATVLDILATAFAENFHGYSETVTTRVLQGRLKSLNLDNEEEYLGRLRSDKQEQIALARLLRVRHSVFFRDSLQYELLRWEVLPTLLEERKALNENHPFRCWSTACAEGEEAYSLAIVLDEAVSIHQPSTACQVFATDVAGDAIEVARSGLFHADKLEQVTLGRLKDNFLPENDAYRVRDHIRGMLSFSRYDMLSRGTYVPPECLFGNFDLILCRNFVMYLDRQTAARVFDKLYKALVPTGVLMLGMAESPALSHTRYWARMFDFGCFFRKA